MQHQIYEYPLSERMRNFMRLENYYQQLLYFAAGNEKFDSQAALTALIEAAYIIDRHDTKSECIQELDRCSASLTKLTDHESINAQALNSILDQLQTHLFALQNTSSNFVIEDPVIQAVKQKNSIGSTLNNFEIPIYYYWYNQDPNRRAHDIQKWIKSIEPILEPVTFLTNLLRNSSHFDSATAEGGFYQNPLNKQNNCHMVRLLLDNDCDVFPEVSGSKHRVSVRFLRTDTDSTRPSQTEDSINFKISLCSI